MSERIVSVGRIVHYRLTAQDAGEINGRRVTRTYAVGNTVGVGDVLPMVVVRVWGVEGVNGQVFLDGNDTLWVTSRPEGTEPGMWSWPELVGGPVPNQVTG